MQSIDNINRNQVVHFVAAHFLDYIKDDKITCKESMFKIFIRQLFFAITDKNNIYYDGINTFSHYNTVNVTIDNCRIINRLSFHINDKKVLCFLHKKVYFIIFYFKNIIKSFIKIEPINDVK